jgi:hypothetical protein
VSSFRRSMRAMTSRLRGDGGVGRCRLGLRPVAAVVAFVNGDGVGIVTPLNPKDRVTLSMSGRQALCGSYRPIYPKKSGKL